MKTSDLAIIYAKLTSVLFTKTIYVNIVYINAKLA